MEVGNCTFGPSPGISWPTVTSGYSSLDNNLFFETKIKRACNGFIVNYQGSEFVFECLDSMMKFLKEKYK